MWIYRDKKFVWVGAGPPGGGGGIGGAPGLGGGPPGSPGKGKKGRGGGGGGGDEGSCSWTASGDISTAVASGTFDYSGQDVNMSAMWFSPDGLKMYLVGGAGDDINEYTLGTAWDVTTASFDQVFAWSQGPTIGRGVAFKYDGTKMYFIGTTENDVREYNLSTPWDVSTASLHQQTDISADSGAEPRNLFIRQDGLKMYLVQDVNSANTAVHEWTLGTAWDVTSKSYVGSFSVFGEEADPTGVWFSPDGTKMYVSGRAGDDVNQYALGTAWNVSTASWVRAESIPDTGVSSVCFSCDGSKMYVSGFGNTDVYEYDIT